MQTASPCPLCRSAEPVEAQAQTLRLAGLGTVDIAFGYCGACGHIYQTRSVSDALLGKHYEQFSNYTCFDTDAARNAPPRASTRRLLSLAEAHVPNRGLAYEVGCATGFHLAQFRKSGWRVSGCDLSPKASAQAREIFAIDVDCGSEADMLPTRTGLDLVYFSHVLEHLRDPLPALIRARDAIADDGMVMLEVPCAIAPESLPPGWFTFEHLQYFSAGAVRAMLARAGLRALEIRIALKAELYPVIAAIAVKDTNAPYVAEPYAAETAEAFLAEFTRRDDSLWCRTAERLDTLKGGIFVWGAGVHTAQLLDRTPLLSHTDIVGIVDRDNQKWGATQADRPIISPEEYLTTGAGAPIVISSYAAEADIARDLLARGVAQNRIVQLYH